MFEMMKQISQTNMSLLNSLSFIEDNVSRLSSIQQEIGLVRNEVSNLKIENFTRQKRCANYKPHASPPSVVCSIST